MSADPADSITPPGDTDDPRVEVEVLRLILADQAAAVDSLERRALTLMAPVAFVLGLAINNAQKVDARLGSQLVFYVGLVVLVGGIVAGASVLWPRRPLHDPTLTPPHHPSTDPRVSVGLMRPSAARNVRGFHRKTLGLRVQLFCFVTGSGLVVAAEAAGTVRALQ